MGKGDKVQIKGSCAFKRINYLYQAAVQVLEQNRRNTELVRFYAHTLKSVAKREVLRIHPDIKRQLCKKCFMLLVPGITSTVRVRGNRQKHTVIRCLDCGTVKRFVADKNYQLHFCNPEVLGASVIGASDQIKQQQKEKEMVRCPSSAATLYTKDSQDANRSGHPATTTMSSAKTLDCDKQSSVIKQTDGDKGKLEKINGVNEKLKDYKLG